MYKKYLTTPRNKIHYVQNPIKIYQACKEAGTHEKNKQLKEIDPDTDDRIMRQKCKITKHI